MSTFESQLQSALRANFPLYEFMQLSVESASDGVFRCSIPLNENNSNHFHTVHAALQWALAEVLGGVAWMVSKPDDGDFLPVVRSFKIDFKKPATGGLVAETHFSDERAGSIKAELALKGRCDFQLESILRNAAGDTIAVAKGDYAIRSASGFSVE